MSSLEELFGESFSDDEEPSIAWGTEEEVVEPQPALQPLLLPLPSSAVGTALGHGPSLYLPTPPLVDPMQLQLSEFPELEALFRDESVEEVTGVGQAEESTTQPSQLVPKRSRRKEPPKRKNKPRQNWTDEESTSLLRGVEKHGIGKWSQIVADHSFGLGHREPVAMKDRFRTMFPEEYELHQKISRQATDGCSVDDGSFSQPQVAVDPALAGSAERPILLELDVETSKQRRLEKRKRAQLEKRRKKEGVQPALRAPESVTVRLTPTGRRAVTRRKGTPWSAEEDAALPEAYRKYGKVWRKMANDTEYPFYGRSIHDIKDRFTSIYPNSLPEPTPIAAADSPNLTMRSPTPPRPRFTFEQAIVNTFDPIMHPGGKPASSGRYSALTRKIDTLSVDLPSPPALVLSTRTVQTLARDGTTSIRRAVVRSSVVPQKMFASNSNRNFASSGTYSILPSPGNSPASENRDESNLAAYAAPNGEDDTHGARPSLSVNCEIDGSAYEKIGNSAIDQLFSPVSMATTTSPSTALASLIGTSLSSSSSSSSDVNFGSAPSFNGTGIDEDFFAGISQFEGSIESGQRQFQPLTTEA